MTTFPRRSAVGARLQRNVRAAALLCALATSMPLPVASAAKSVRRAAPEQAAVVAHAEHLADGMKVVDAAERGAPWISYGDGVELDRPLASDAGASDALKRRQLEPATVAAADFDEDGVPDLVVTYTGPNGGAIAVTHGNMRAIYPHAPLPAGTTDPGDAPFVGAARTVATTVGGELSVVGDVDRDGHQDVVVALKGGSTLTVYKGDGKGGLAMSHIVDTQATITTLAGGEVDRPDGVTDIAVGLTGAGGNRLLVYPSYPHGLAGTPEPFKLDAPPTAIAIGRLERNERSGIAVAAGRTLEFIHGKEVRSKDDRAVERRSIGFEVSSMAFGGFANPGSNDLAMLGADGRTRLLEAGTTAEKSKLAALRMHAFARDVKVPGGSIAAAGATSHTGEDIVVVDAASRRLLIREAADPSDASADLDVATEPVAVLPMRLNSDGIDDLVVLRKGSTSPSFIVSRPRMTFTVINSNAAGAGSLADAITQANGSSGLDMIDFNISALTTISPTVGYVVSDAVTIDATTQTGFSGTPIVRVDGTSAMTNTQAFDIVVTTGVTIRGFSLTSFAGDGIVITASASGEIIEGNYIGVATNGTTGAGNGATGVTIIDSPNNTIGGTVAASRNVISDNGAQGVQISSFSSTGNFVQGNYIGTSADGMSAISNGLNGVEIVDASTNSVGGALVGAGNVISGNSTGAGLANGVYSHGFTNSCDVFGNYIGIAADGSTALANGANGVLTGDNGLAIGTGTTLGRNVISGNTGSGVMTGGSGGGATIWANYIGLDASGTSAVGNGLAGVTLQDSVVVEVGDPMPGFGNVVSGNTGNGIAVLGATVSSFIAGNSVGTDGSGSGSIGNGGNGIVAADNALVDFFANNVVGSSQNGIVISDNASVDIIQTTVSGSGSLGIDLNNDGITANDPLDADSGPNTLQNFPIITSANYDGMLHVAGTLSSMQNMQYHIEVFVSDSCSSSGNGEGQYFAGSVDVSTDFTGDAPFTLDVFPGFPLNPGSVATATASLLDVPPGRSNGPSNPDTTLVPYNTSEFSPCVAIMLPPGPDLSITMGGVPDPVAPLGDVTYTISVTNNDLKAVADGVVVNGTTPAGMTFQSWSVPGGWATTDPGAGNAGAYSAQTAMLFSGTEVLTLVLRVDASTPGGTMLDNTVVVTQSASETDTSNNMATATVTVVGSPSADLSVTVDGTPDPVGAGSEATFTITVANAGPTDTGVILDSAVPDNTTLVSLTAPPGWSCKAPGPGGTGGISCSTQLLASGTQQTFTLVVLVDEGTADGTLITTTASVQGFDPDPNTGNNSASKSITVAPPDAADLQLNLSAAPNPVAVGGTLTYTLEVNNLGPAAANSVTLTNTLPQLVGFVSATASTGGSITAPAMGQTGIVSCSWPGATAPGSSLSLVIVTQVSPAITQSTTVADAATVSSLSPDPDATNNSTSTATAVDFDENTPRADVSVSMTGGTGSIVTGDFVQYSIAVANAGPNDAEEVALSGSTPLGTRLVSLTSPQGEIDGPSVGASGPYTVNIGTIESGNTVTVTLVVNVNAPGGSTIENSVAISSATNDPDPADNSTSASGTVMAGNDVQLTWDPPLQTNDDSLNPPLHLQTRPVTGASIVHFAGNLHKLRNSLVGYNVYRSNSPNTQATAANLFTTVPPSVTTLVAGTAPSGSYFTVTAQYPNGESGASNAASGGLPQPSIASVQFRAGKMIVNGVDFNDQVTVFVDGIPFKKGAKVKGEGTKIQQKGKLLTGQSVQSYISGQGGVALISVLNEDSGIGTFLYRP